MKEMVVDTIFDSPKDKMYMHGLMKMQRRGIVIEHNGEKENSMLYDEKNESPGSFSDDSDNNPHLNLTE